MRYTNIYKDGDIYYIVVDKRMLELRYSDELTQTLCLDAYDLVSGEIVNQEIRIPNQHGYPIMISRDYESQIVIITYRDSFIRINDQLCLTSFRVAYPNELKRFNELSKYTEREAVNNTFKFLEQKT